MRYNLVMTQEEFVSNLAQNNIVVSEEQLEQFAVYYALLSEHSRNMNLTTIIKEEEVYSKHFYDSLLLLADGEFSGAVVDVGSGAGFPGIPIKIMCPDVKLTIVEPTGKKIGFIELVVRELKLTEVELVNRRAEDFAAEKREFFDIAVCRAVADLAVISELCLPLIKVNGEFWAMKGPGGEEELAKSQAAIKTLGGTVKGIFRHYYDNQSRCNIVIIKTKATPLKYPRNYGQIKNSPLGR